MEDILNQLYIEDKGLGNISIKINGLDITRGITEYKLIRGNHDGVVQLVLKMNVVPEHICIEKKSTKL